MREVLSLSSFSAVLPGHPGCTRLEHARKLYAADLSTPPAGGFRPLPHGPGAPGHVPRPKRGRRRWRSAALREPRTSGLPALRPAGARLPACALRRLLGRHGGGVQLQGARLLSFVRGPPHDRAGGASRRSSDSRCSGTAVGAVVAVVAALPAGLRRRAERVGEVGIERRAPELPPRQPVPVAVAKGDPTHGGGEGTPLSGPPSPRRGLPSNSLHAGELTTGGASFLTRV